MTIGTGIVLMLPAAMIAVTTYLTYRATARDRAGMIFAGAIGTVLGLVTYWAIWLATGIGR